MATGVKSTDLNNAISNSKEIRKIALSIAQNKLDTAKSELINDFISHSVSKEINSGPEASNMSGTLGGYGNLFSFIGFDAGSSPINLWVSFLKTKIRIKNKNPNIKYSGNDNISFEFDVSGISDTEFISASQMPWESGRSWIKAIEQGISGFSFYISKKLGRSGGGIQSKNQARSVQYQKTSYWTSMWEKFLVNLK